MGRVKATQLVMASSIKTFPAWNLEIICICICISLCVLVYLYLYLYIFICIFKPLFVFVYLYLYLYLCGMASSINTFPAWNLSSKRTSMNEFEWMNEKLMNVWINEFEWMNEWKMSEQRHLPEMPCQNGVEMYSIICICICICISLFVFVNLYLYLCICICICVFHSVTLKGTCQRCHARMVWRGTQWWAELLSGTRIEQRPCPIPGRVGIETLKMFGKATLK